MFEGCRFNDFDRSRKGAVYFGCTCRMYFKHAGGG
jgi:hypothetical protein